jgi:hypothetical protein
MPNSVLSDNGKQFILTNQTLHKVIKAAEGKRPDVTAYFNSSRIKLSFLPAYAPWMGGFYERLIGLTKPAMMRTIILCNLSDDQWDTVLTEIEAK